MTIKSRYTDIADVQFRAEDLPTNLVCLYSAAKEWCLSNPNEVELLASEKTPEELNYFINIFSKSQNDIDLFLEEEIQHIPVPDSVVIVDLEIGRAHV